MNFKKIATKFELFCIKYFPILMNFIIVIIFIENLIGKYFLSELLDPIFGYSLFVAIFFLSCSISKRFCIWHTLLCFNMVFNMILLLISNSYEIPDICFLFSVSTSLTLILSIIMLLKYGFSKSKL